MFGNITEISTKTTATIQLFSSSETQETSLRSAAIRRLMPRSHGSILTDKALTMSTNCCVSKSRGKRVHTLKHVWCESFDASRTRISFSGKPASPRVLRYFLELLHHPVSL